MSLLDNLKSLQGETIIEVRYGTYNSEHNCVQEGIVIKLSSGRCITFIENTWLEYTEWKEYEAQGGVSVEEYNVMNLNWYKSIE